MAIGLLLLLGMGCGEAEHFDVLNCRITEAELIDANEAPLGFSANAVVQTGAIADGRTLRFGSERNPGPRVALDVGLEAADTSRVFWVRKAHVISGDFHPPCPQALTFPATVVFRTSDGQFKERLQVQLYATAVNAHEWRAELLLDEVHGSFEVPSWPLPWDDSVVTDPDGRPHTLAYYGRFDADSGSEGSVTVLAWYPERNADGGAALARWGAQEEP